MTDDEFDDALDELPLHKRNKVLRLVGQEERAPPPKRRVVPTEREVRRGFATLFAVMFGMPVCAIGMAMIVTVVLAPLGFIVTFIGAWPLYRVVKKATEERVRRDSQ